VPLADVNAILRVYLAANAGLAAVVGTRIYCPRLPENATLPALGYFTRGGTSNPHIPGIVTPSVQFDCWGATPQAAREVYRALYDALEGLQDTPVVLGATTYRILSAIEEVQGQDLVDVDIQDYFRVLTFFEVMVRADT